jgi:threonine synthase
MNMTGFECVACGQRQGTEYRAYVCPACGGNLQVTYDYERVRAELDPARPFGHRREDIFRYLPLLPIGDLSLAPRLRIGATPLYPARGLGATAGLDDLWLKDEGLNPSASFKDRASAVAITRARELGAELVAGASTGNAGSSMACMAASVGMPCVIFVPAAAPAAKIAQLLIFGARVLAVRGTYDEAFDLCHEVCNKRGWFNRNTGYNPYTREGKKTCSFELCEQFAWHPPDRVVVPVGDGNIISGIWKGLKELHILGLIDRLPKLVCAQSNGSAGISRAIENLQREHADPSAIDWSDLRIDPVHATTVADSISVDQPRDGLAAVRAVVESGGDAVTVADGEIMEAVREIARLSGVFVEPSSATTWACLKQMVAEERVGTDERVLCLLTGSGLKDIAGARRIAGEPTEIDPTGAAAEAALDL